MLTQQKKFQKIRNIKDTIQASSNFEEMRLQQLKIEIGDIESNYSEEIKLERTQYLNRNSTISLFLLKDNFWKKFWLLKVSWFWEKETIGPLIKISAYDCKNSKNESSYKLLDWDRFLKRIGNKFLNFSELEEEFFIYFGLHRRTKKMLLESFKKSFQINNNRILVLSDEEKNKSHKNERDFFKKKEIFGFDLWNLKIPKITVAKNENLFKKGFDDIYKHFFENKREYLEDEKEKEVKIVNMEENDDFSQEKHLKNTILIEENVEKQDRKKSLRCFRIEKQNTFYNYFKNFIKDHNLLQLYCRLPRKFSLLNLKLSFCFYDENNSVEVNLKFYDPFRRNNFYYNMYDLKDIILITNILLVDNPKIRKKNLSQIVNDVLQYNGIRLNCRNSQNNTQKKPILNENTLKSFIMNSFLEKNTRFNQTSVVFLQKLPNLGKVIVFIDIFESKQATSENRVLFSIKILDFFSKIRRFKIILSLDDISFYFPQHTLTEKTSLHEIKLHFMKILTYFSLEKLSIYSCLVFFPSNYHDILHNNLRKAASSNRFERTRKYKNCFNEKRGIPIFPKKNNCLLDEFVQDSRNIVKIIKKHQGNFYFITVSKNLLMNYWIIKIYLPKSSRNFMGYLNNSELLKFSVEDLSKAFDRNLKDFIEKPRDCESFMGFLNQIMQTPQMLTFSQAFDKAYPSKRNSNGNNLLYKFNQKFKLQKAALVNKFTSKRMKKMQKIKALMNLTKKIDNFKGNFFEKNLFEFSEIEFWMRLLNKLEISSDKSNKFEIKQGEFRLRLKEFFFNKYVKVDNYNEAIIEIFFFFLNENPSVFTTLDSIHYAYLMNYNFVIKYLSLNRMNIQINSINLRELVNIYISDGFFKHPTNYMHSKLLISDVKDLCNFLIYKIKSANFCNFLHNSNETVIKRRKMHANDNISYMKNIEKEAKLGNEETHLITFVIRAKKYLVVRVFMQIITCKIFIKVYKNQTNELFIKEFRFAELRNCDGFFKELIKKGEWKIIVERLWAITKKELLIEAEFNFKFNES